MPEETTTTVPYVPELPPELVGDPRAPFLVDPGDDTVDLPIAQRSFDPLSVAIRPELVAAATAAVQESTVAFDLAQRQLAEQAASVADLTAQLAKVEKGSREAVAKASAARADLLERAVTAYMVGDMDQRLALLDTDDMVDLGVARNYVGVIVDTNERLLHRYQQLRSSLDRDQVRLADDLAQATVDLSPRRESATVAFAELLDRFQALQAYQAGAQAYVDGFVFPVAGDVEFIDSWGYPRMTGTSSAHWHQGTDIFAAHGTPLIASENGVLTNIGVGSLGGNKLWVRGDSGTEYYYAHLSAFAEGVVEGRPVRAGEVVGYVGDTGNAKGTSPHLHFEIHPSGGDAVNPYPLLKAAYGNRPMVKATAPVSIPPAIPVAPAPGTPPDAPVAPVAPPAAIIAGG